MISAGLKMSELAWAGYSTDMSRFLDTRVIDTNQAVLIEGVGVDLDHFVPTTEKEGPLVVIMASRMLWDKGVKEFVNVARMLKSSHPDVRFALVGAPDPGNPTNIPKEQLYHWVQEGVIEWWGHRADMPDVFKDTHIVTLPSKSEGLATVLLEAAASSRPIVATDIPGCREVVRDGISGLLVPVGNLDSFAQAIETLILDKDLRRRMGLAGRQWVEERFNQKVINQRTERIYEEFHHR